VFEGILQCISVTANNATIELTGKNTKTINPKEQCENETYWEQKNNYKPQETYREHYKKYQSKGTI
jgi:hypothetical protein